MWDPRRSPCGPCSLRRASLALQRERSLLTGSRLSSAATNLGQQRRRLLRRGSAALRWTQPGCSHSALSLLFLIKESALYTAALFSRPPAKRAPADSGRERQSVAAPHCSRRFSPALSLLFLAEESALFARSRFRGARKAKRANRFVATNVKWRRKQTLTKIYVT